MAVYTVKSVRHGEQWSSQYGAMQAYHVQFNEIGGEVVWNRKAGGKSPSVGEVVEGDITTDNRGNPKFKQSYQAGQKAQYSPGQTTMSPSTPTVKAINDGLGQAWGNALTNAVTLHTNLTDDAEKGGLPELRARIIETAQYFFDNRFDAPKKHADGTETVADAQSGDNVVTELPSSPVNLDEIPF